jgi:hypothetical protein
MLARIYWEIIDAESFLAFGNLRLRWLPLVARKFYPPLDLVVLISGRPSSPLSIELTSVSRATLLLAFTWNMREVKLTIFAFFLNLSPKVFGQFLFLPSFLDSANLF